MTKAAEALAQAREYLCSVDPVMAKAIEVVEQHQPLKPLKRSSISLFQRVVRTIVEQQLSLAAAATIWQRVCDAHGDADPQHWSSLDEQDLRSCGLSGAKARACIANARIFADSEELKAAWSQAPASLESKRLSS